MVSMPPWVRGDVATFQEDEAAFLKQQGRVKYWTNKQEQDEQEKAQKEMSQSNEET